MELSTDHDTPLLTPSAPRQSTLFLSVSLLLFFTQFAALSLPASFLALSPAGRQIGLPLVGAVFSCHPLGKLLASPLPTFLIRRVGARAAVVSGLCCAACSSLLCGLAPSVFDNTAALAAAMITARLAGGAGSCVAEVAAFTVLSTSDLQGRLGLVMSLVEVAVGSGVAAGTAAGGALYRVGEGTAIGAFLLPFLIAAAAPLALLPLVVAAVPSRTSEAPAEPLSSSMLTVGRAAVVVSVVLWTSAAEGILPVLGPVWRAQPALHFTPPAVGLAMTLNSGVYMLASLPIGWLIDRPALRDRRRSVMAAGWALLLVGFALLGPLEDGAPLADTLAGMAVVGVSSAMVVVPTMPDLQAGLRTEGEKAAVSTIWTSAFSTGSLFGPIIAAAVTKGEGFVALCAGLMAMCAAGAVAFWVLAFRRGKG